MQRAGARCLQVLFAEILLIFKGRQISLPEPANFWIVKDIPKPKTLLVEYYFCTNGELIYLHKRVHLLVQLAQTRQLRLQLAARRLEHLYTARDGQTYSNPY